MKLLPYYPFLILTEGRSGTTLLKELLNCHPSIFCDGEILDSDKNLSLTLKRGRKLSEHLSYGFKCRIMMLDNLSNSQQIIPKFVEEGWKVIALHRQNIFRHAISYFIGAQLKRKTGSWHIRTTTLDMENEAIPEPKLCINPPDLLQRMNWLDKIWTIHTQILSETSHLSLSYERDLLCQSMHQETANRCFEYLGLPRYQVTSNMKRIVNDDLSLFVKNLDEILDYLKSSKYSEFLKIKNNSYVFF